MLMAVVKEVLIDLVGEDEQIMLDSERRQRLGLCAGKDLAGRIRRRVENNGASALADGGPNLATNGLSECNLNGRRLWSVESQWLSLYTAAHYDRCTESPL